MLSIHVMNFKTSSSSFFLIIHYNWTFPTLSCNSITNNGSAHFLCSSPSVITCLPSSPKRSVQRYHSKRGWHWPHHVQWTCHNEWLRWKHSAVVWVSRFRIKPCETCATRGAGYNVITLFTESHHQIICHQSTYCQWITAAAAGRVYVWLFNPAKQEMCFCGSVLL